MTPIVSFNAYIHLYVVGTAKVPKSECISLLNNISYSTIYFLWLKYTRWMSVESHY